MSHDNFFARLPDVDQPLAAGKLFASDDLVSDDGSQEPVLVLEDEDRLKDDPFHLGANLWPEDACRPTASATRPDVDKFLLFEVGNEEDSKAVVEVKQVEDDHEADQNQDEAEPCPEVICLDDSPIDTAVLMDEETEEPKPKLARIEPEPSQTPPATSEESITPDSPIKLAPVTGQQKLDLIHRCENSPCVVQAMLLPYQLEQMCRKTGIEANLKYEPSQHRIDSKQRRNAVKNVGNYQVEAIYNSTEEGGRVLFEVKWRGWATQHNTWEPRCHLNSCKDLIDEFRTIEYRSEDEHREELHWFYRSFHQLYSIVDELTERPMRNLTSKALLMLFGDKPLGYSIASDFKFNDLRKELRAKLMPIFDSVLEKKDATKRLELMKRQVFSLAHQLNIITRYGDGSGQFEKEAVDKFFDFCDRHRETILKLKEWEKSVNQIIGKTSQHLSVENFVDLDTPPKDFVYITERKPAEGIVVTEDPPIFCQCANCFDEKESCCTATNSLSNKLYLYSQKETIAKVFERRHIYECNKNCICPPNCYNRVIQRGTKYRLAIFKTDNGRGWGVKTLDPIPRGSFVMEYVGEIITVDEAVTRGKKYDSEGLTYQFDIDYNDKDGEAEEDEVDELNAFKYVVDATNYGNVAHFVNHSCEPNLETVMAWINNYDPFMPHIVLFSIRDIHKNEELTYDYKINVRGISDSVPEQQQVQEQEQDKSDEQPIGDHESDDSGIERSSWSGTDNPLPEPIPDLLALDATDEDKPKAIKRILCKCGAKSCKKYLI